MVYEYNLKHIGLGDLTFFCGEMILKLQKDDVLKVKIDEVTLNLYRNNSKEYKEFCIQYIKYVLSDYNVMEYDSKNNSTLLGWEIKSDSVIEMLNNDKVKNIVKDRFSSGKLKYDSTNCVILFTKVRDYHVSSYELISKEFWDKLNSIDTKYILLGERKIKYEGEYSIHGKELIYSLYDDYIQNIDSDKLIDLTENDFNAENINLENIINDLTLVSKSKKIVMIGGGGFFCTSLFTDKLISLYRDDLSNSFVNEVDKQIFVDFNKFLTQLENV
jgi:hypothetical protein